MSKHQVRGKEVKVKLAELHDINNRTIEVEKSIEELRAYHEELVNRRLAVKTEIRFLGGKVPTSNNHAAGAILWRLREGRL
ncbi:hypothetical protein ES703_51856 [subsurface metagenome]